MHPFYPTFHASLHLRYDEEMIRHISGTISEVNPLSLVVSVGGIGYFIYMPRMSADYTVGTEVSVHTYLVVRENLLDLYGFATRDDLEMFELLIELPKIGPKTALQIMSQAETELIRKAALTGDPSYLSKMSGIGKKSAEKIVVGLKDKLGGEDLQLGEDEQSDSDVIDALLALGYSQREARDATLKLPPEITDTNTRVREALKLLGK